MGGSFLFLKGGPPMAVSTGYDYGVRKGLVGKGIADADINYDKNSGYVTVKGQNFLKPPKVYQGTSFTSQQDFNSAWDTFNKPKPDTGVVTAQANPVAAPAYNPYATNNPYDTQTNDLLAKLLQQATNPTPVDVNQIYASPQYAAFQAQAQRGAQQGIRAAQESMGSAGFGRSTALGERAQDVQNDANTYLQTQVLPQLMSQAAAERQQNFQNQFGALNALTGQQGVYDTRFNNTNERAFREGELTGDYLSPEAQSTIDQIISLGEAWKTGTPEQKAQFSAEADRLRGLLPGMGVDASLFGANVTTEGRRANMGKAGVRTLQGEQFDRGNVEADREWEYQQERDKIMDERDKRDFDENVRRFGLDYAIQKRQIAVSEKNARTSAASAGNAASNASHNKLMDIWKATGKAPAGIEGVPVGTPWYDAAAARNEPVPYDQTPEWSQEISDLNKDPQGTYDDIKSNPNDYISAYGYDGYQELLRQAKALKDD